MNSKSMKNKQGVVYTPWMREHGGEYIPSDSAHGMVYRIFHKPTGRWYIGKKQVHKTVKMSKREIALLSDEYRNKDGSINRSRSLTKRVYSDWRTYKSSCDDLQKMIKTDIGIFGEIPSTWEFTVLYECITEAQLKYFEARAIMMHDGLLDELCYNSNIHYRQIGRINIEGVREL